MHVLSVTMSVSGSPVNAKVTKDDGQTGGVQGVRMNYRAKDELGASLCGMINWHPGLL